LIAKFKLLEGTMVLSLIFLNFTILKAFYTKKSCVETEADKIVTGKGV